jgi:hypothetical protein
LGTAGATAAAGPAYGSVADLWYPDVVSKEGQRDHYESRYMTGDAEVRHRDKRVSRGMAILLMMPALFTLAMTFFLGFANATAAQPVPAAALPLVLAAMVAFSAMFVVLSLTFAVLRSVVTDRELIVKYGLWGPRIALDSITSCKVVPYKWTQFGGWGIRRGAGGVWAYVPGPGDVVEIAYTDRGKDKRIQVGADNAPMLAAEIERARQAGTSLRIDTSDDDAAALVEAERELAAVEEAELGEAKQRR